MTTPSANVSMAYGCQLPPGWLRPCVPDLSTGRDGLPRQPFLAPIGYDPGPYVHLIEQTKYSHRMRLSRGQRFRVSVALIMALGALASGIAGQLQPGWYLATAASAIGAAAVGVGTYRQMRPDPRTAAVTEGPQDWPPTDGKVWNIPQPVIDFVGRAEDIKIIKKLRSLRGPVGMALYGIGGIGKSQLALKYGASERDNLQIGWIINAAKRDYILEGLSQLGTALHLPRPSDPAEGARETLEELGRRMRWLIIYDDAPNF